jgi:hypothetical protein
MEMVGATAIDLTAFVRSRILNLFVGFVRFVVKHPVSGRRAIGPITLVVGDWSRPCDREGDREGTAARISYVPFLLTQTHRPKGLPAQGAGAWPLTRSVLGSAFECAHLQPESPTWSPRKWPAHCLLTRSLE